MKYVSCNTFFRQETTFEKRRNEIYGSSSQLANVVPPLQTFKLELFMELFAFPDCIN